MFLLMYSVVAVDSSGSAISMAATNAALNGLTSEVIEKKQLKQRQTLEVEADCNHGKGCPPTITFIQSDAEKFMDTLVSGNGVGSDVPTQYDVVVCDPPKFAPTKKSLRNAKTK